MKDYEKAAVAIGVAALGLAAYQAMKTKEAVDAQKTTDPEKNPVKAAVDLSKNMVGGLFSWFNKRFDASTGKIKGRAENIIDTMVATPANIFYGVKGAVDYGKDATETGTKYVYSLLTGAASSGKQKVEQLTNKPFTLMGSFAEKFTISNPLPKAGQTITNAVTGIGSKLEFVEEKTNSTKNKIVNGLVNVKNQVFSIFGR